MIASVFSCIFRWGIKTIKKNFTCRWEESGRVCVEKKRKYEEDFKNPSKKHVWNEKHRKWVNAVPQALYCSSERIFIWPETGI